MPTGVLIAGGSGTGITTELFLPVTGKTCSLASLPSPRTGHTLNLVGSTIVLCSAKSCLQFQPSSGTGSWSSYSTLAESRYYHTSHVTQDGLLLLLGGDGSRETAELVGGGEGYNLKYGIR